MTIDVASGQIQNYTAVVWYNALLTQSSLTLKLLSEVGEQTDATGGTVVSAGWHVPVSVDSSDFVDAESLGLPYYGIANNRTYAFPPVTSTAQSVQGVGIFSGSTCLVVWPTTTTLNVGERATFLPGSLRLSVDNLPYVYGPT